MSVIAEIEKLVFSRPEACCQFRLATWMGAKEIIMQNKKRVIDPIPESFATEAEAGKFWDTHSTADYLEFLEPADHTIDLQTRVYEVLVAEDIFEKLQHEAKQTHQSLPKTLDTILRKALSTV